MVEDIWMAVDQHANISKDFTDRANYFREKNFVDARRLVAEEIARGRTYVPDYLNFEGINNSVSRSNVQGSAFNQTTSVYHNTSSQLPVQAGYQTTPQVQATSQNSYYQPQTVTYQTTTSQYHPQQSYQTEGSQFQSYYTQNIPQQTQAQSTVNQYQTYQVANPNINNVNLRPTNLGNQPQIVSYGHGNDYWSCKINHLINTINSLLIKLVYFSKILYTQYHQLPNYLITTPTYW